MNQIRSDSTFKGAMGRPLMKVVYLNKMSSKENRNRICKDVFMTISIVIFTKKDFYLLDELNHQIGMFQASGLIDFWHNQDINRGIVDENDSKIPTVLTLRQMMSSFQILLIGLFVSLVVHIIELFLKYLPM